MIAAAVAARLRAEGFGVEVAHDGLAGVALCDRLRPDLVVLDLMLPGLDGLEVCRRIQRDRAGPGADADRARRGDRRARRARRGRRRLHDQAVLAARARRAHPRAAAPRGAPAGAGGRGASRSGALALDPERRRVAVGGAEVHLTPTEFDLLALLAARPGVVFTRDQLLAEVWGWRDGAGHRTVDSHVRGLRRKLGAAWVRTVHGVGYALEPEARRVRPLDRLPSIKVKLGVVIVATVAGTVLVLRLGARLDLSLPVRVLAATAIGLLVVQLLARGTTSPLREMAAAASAMARGDHAVRVTGDVARRGRRARPRVQLDGGGAGRRRPPAARPRRQRVARAAHADRRAAGAAGEPRRRRRAARPRDAAGGAGADGAARPARRAAARPVAHGVRGAARSGPSRSRSGRCSSRRCASTSSARPAACG